MPQEQSPARVQWGGSALLAPVPPVLVTCCADGRVNVLTVGWTGICATHPPMTYISLRPSRFSYGIIRETGVFAVNLPTTGLVRAVDFCGVRSGRDTDKLAACGLHAVQPGGLAVPVLEESPVSLICRVQQVIPLGSHEMFLAEIEATSVDGRYVDSKGKLNLQQSGLLAYAHGEYFALGRKCGEFGFSVRKSSAKKKKRGVPG
ncbi:MAG: flavin reductase family protein [Oscillospiraceae bacterium]|nr:flavin reductase family protein [Oscillospiraceae bacterium]